MAGDCRRSARTSLPRTLCGSARWERDPVGAAGCADTCESHRTDVRPRRWCRRRSLACTPPRVTLSYAVTYGNTTGPTLRDIGMLIDTERLARFATRVFEATGATEPVAREVADHL